MSAPADSTQSGGKAIPDEPSHLDQPRDAVPMESMPQPLLETAATAHDADKAVTTKDDSLTKDAIEPSSSTAVPSTSESPEQSSVTAPVSLKGKEKENAPLPPAKESQDPVMAIGAAVDDIKSVMPGGSDGPVCNITLLLTSGSRHPYKIDAKYLSRRNVEIPDENESGQPDPFSISIYTLKELILREWRSDWEAKPSSPSSIRLIHFGKLLDDKEQLKKYQLSMESPNVVHMSIRPQDLDEEEPKTGSKNLASGGGDGQRQRGGGCCVVL
ncbi:ubiquitin-related domain-containing protein [Dactylonectria macrodidyma]|uniref:Ubiquitin-related domain-containing protein n=1 Tax=Dactylonectria macrodidyma TaxID=307937 RepID=A0A9P9FFH4_9HYPO|nr:ubiquitin-related domain-containing protein [Dactylonectria macrodidyma]